jgi:flavin-dependent dehydrogenase
VPSLAAILKEPTSGGYRALPDPAVVAVVGGGPAGSFFALHLLRRAARLGKAIEVIILEKKREVCFYEPAEFCAWEGCNYCAGGVSPRLADILQENRIYLPPEIIESRATEVIVHGDWKSIQLPVPEGRHMMSVFRGSHPRQRAERYHNFDTFLLHAAVQEGATVLAAEVRAVARSASGRLSLTFREAVSADADTGDKTLEADFVVVSAGVNRIPGMNVNNDPLFASLRTIMPHLRAPRVRRAVIAELQAEEGLLRPLEGEVHFAQHGSKEIDIEMSSLLPKGSWLTVVLLGRTIDAADPSQYLRIVQEFVDLPHIRLLLPPKTELRAGCCCHPNMTVGAAKDFVADGVALAGDMAVSRLYKDGLYSAHVTSSALADCLLDVGIDRKSLVKGYAPVIAGFDRDNRYGRMIFWLSRWFFGHPALSRVLYQAIITERMTRPKDNRPLGDVLWRIASGDDTYRHILRQMLRPSSLWAVLTSGLLATIRNKLTEYAFGLDWTGIGRYTTGVPLEEVARKRLDFFAELQIEPPTQPPQVEEMFSIRIRASREVVWQQLGTFGDAHCDYFNPRFINVHRTAGAGNQLGTTIRYDNILRALSFDVRLKKLLPGRYLLYEMQNGFNAGGIFAFETTESPPGITNLTIYVGFDYPRVKQPLGRLGWFFGRHLFPEYAHNVLWNHSLCRLKHLAELATGEPSPGHTPTGPAVT